VTQQKRALICEDDASIRSLVRAVAARHGFDVETAADGEEGMAKLRDDCYELVILDLMMPGVDGYGVLEFVRERRPSQVKRILVMTASAQAITARFPAPICRVLAKPFDITDLTAALNECAGACSS
jgi:DNA-binding response OmpR family regulator